MEHTITMPAGWVEAPRTLLATRPEHWQHHHTDVLVVGGGAAGLAAALRAAQDADVIVLSRGPLLESNSSWAQGGIAAALDAQDSPRFHIDDTLIAGAGLCDVTAVAALAWDAPDLMREMAALGVPFEREHNGFVLGLEGGHSQRRIVHAGDATGWALTSTLADQARRTPRIRIMEGYQAVELVGPAGQCTGMLALDREGGWHVFNAGATILATGGAGALYGLTSNQPGALGEGIALAYRAGAEIADMEFVQFHPTVFRTANGNGFLITEAARGEGGRLLTPQGERFMPNHDARAELAPRDIVSRAIFAEMQRHNSDYVLLDLTHLSPAFLEERFPTIMARCRSEGLDPATQPIPVAPASHYLMGGIRTDLHGATTLPGLYAAGECACTGVHGANRLASNSLLECLVFGRRAAVAALHIAAEVPSGQRVMLPQAAERGAGQPSPEWRAELATLMRTHASLRRTGAGLTTALAALARIPDRLVRPQSDEIVAVNAALAARLIVASALMRTESRGGHFRVDFPETDPLWQRHLVLTRGQPPRTLATIAEETLAGVTLAA